MPKIIGSAIDEDTDTPISNTRIDIENEERYRTSTDAGGKFEITVDPDEYTISLHSAVYKDAKTKVTVEDEDVEIEIKSKKKRRIRS